MKEELKQFWDYIRFADMGGMGEGCLMSIFYWIIIILFGIGVIWGVITI